MKRAKAEPGGAFLATSAAGLYVQFAAQLVAGLLLHSRYRPTLEEAHSSVTALRAEPLYRFLADFHYWGGALLVATSAFHVLAMLWLGWYKSPHAVRWFASLAFLGGAFGLQLTGNLLPMARHDVQTAVIEGAIAGRVPLVGEKSRELILQGEQFGQPTLTAWYQAHQILLPVLILVMAVAAWISHRAMKDVREHRAFMFLPLLAVISLAFYVPAPFGAAAVEADFNRFDSAPGWYVWPMHGMLKAAEAVRPDLAWVGVALLPGLLAMFLLALPVWKPKLGVARLGIVAFAGVFGASGAFYGGSPAPITGDQDPAVIEVESGPSTDPIDESLSAQGRKLFADEGCNGCHGDDGRRGTGGPDLGRLFQRMSDREWLIEFIRDPQSKKPTSTMPGYPDLPDAKLRALAEFLVDPNLGKE